MDENETDALAATLAAARGRKRQAGKKIKAWTAAFKAEHGREPTLEEKEAIRDLYSQYARATGTLKTIKNKAATSKHGEVPRSSELQAVQTTHALEVERAKEVDDVESKIEERLERMREVQPSASSPETSFLEDESMPDVPLGVQDFLLHIRARAQSEDEGAAEFTKEFDAEAKSQIKRLEAETQQARVNEAERRAQSFRKRELDLVWREHNARDRVGDLEQALRTSVAEERQKLWAANEGERRSIGRQFRRARVHLEQVVRSQAAHTAEVFGRLVPGDKAAARRYSVNWDFQPQPVEIRVHLLRSVRDKLPRGRYAILVSMYDRLAGCPLRWTKQSSYSGGGFGERPAATRPVSHGGMYYHSELRVEQSLFALCPSTSQIRPANTFVFELFRLSEPDNPKDEVVAWGVLPMCNESFGVVQGCFRIPLVRGEQDRTIDRHGELENIYAKDLSQWLCNMYLEVRHLPRSALSDTGRVVNEADVEFDFINRLLVLGPEERRHREAHKRLQVASQNARATTAFGASESDAHSSATQSEARLLVPPSPSSSPVTTPTGSWWQRRQSIFRTKSARQRRNLMSTHLRLGNYVSEHLAGAMRSSRVADVEMDAAEALESGQRGQDSGGGGIPNFATDGELEREESRVRDGAAEPTEEDYLLDDADSSRVAGREVSVADNAAQLTGIRRRRGEGARWDPAGLDLLPKGTSGTVAPSGRWHALRDELEMEAFTFAVCPNPAQQTTMRVHAIVRSKMRYLLQEMFGDLGPHGRQAGDFWFTLVIYAAALWGRMYIHFFGQLLYLQANSIPLFRFEVHAHVVQFKYLFSSMTTGVEIGAVIMGPLACVTALVFFAAVGYSVVKFVGHVPDWFSKFVAAWCAGCILDPLLVLAVDLVAGNFGCSRLASCRDDYTAAACRCVEGDAFKLWSRLESEDASGVMGLVYTAIIYCATIIVSLAGSPADRFFVPHDFEISEAELTAILAAAKVWRGSSGEKMVTTVCDYDFVDPLLGVQAPELVETTTHVSVYKIALSGERSLVRHFLRTPDGSVVEIMGDVSKAFLAERPGVDTLLKSAADGAGRGTDGVEEAKEGDGFAGLAAEPTTAAAVGSGHFAALALL